MPAKPDATLALLRRANGLDLSGAKPWHVKAHYEVFDADGNSTEKGIFEETYAGPQKLHRSYTSDKFTQTDFVTEKGTFRIGESKWPGFADQGVELLIADPLTFGPDAKGLSLTKGQHSFGSVKFDCVLIRPKEGSENPAMLPNADAAAVVNASPVMAYAQYCVEPGHPLLRYSSEGHGLSAVSYNNPVLFQDRYVSRDLLVVTLTKKRLSIHIDQLTTPTTALIASLDPPADADGPLPPHVRLTSSMYPKQSAQIIHDMPDVPAAARNQGVKGGFVAANLTVDATGHVTRVEPLAGPATLYPSAIAAAIKWRFKPVLVNGQPTEVEMLDTILFGGGGGRR